MNAQTRTASACSMARCPRVLCRAEASTSLWIMEWWNLIGYRGSKRLQMWAWAPLRGGNAGRHVIGRPQRYATPKHPGSSGVRIVVTKDGSRWLDAGASVVGRFFETAFGKVLLEVGMHTNGAPEV